jgi:ASC-1-like (ASCH) protein
MDYYSKYQKYKTKYMDLCNNQNVLIGGKSEYTKSVSEPWFTLISLGIKTIEGRLNKGDFKKMEIGDIVVWTNEDFKPRSVKTKIVRKTEYKTFSEYLETEGLDKCLPGMPTMDHGLSVYYKYFTKEDEEKYGVSAIELEID